MNYLENNERNEKRRTLPLRCRSCEYFLEATRPSHSVPRERYKTLFKNKYGGLYGKSDKIMLRIILDRDAHCKVSKIEITTKEAINAILEGVLLQ